MLNIIKAWLMRSCDSESLQTEFVTGRILRCQKREPDGRAIRYSILKESSSNDSYKWEVYDYYPMRAEVILRFRCLKYEDAVRGYEAIILPGTDNDWEDEFLSWSDEAHIQ